MSKKGVLRTVTDRFCLFNDGRKLGANKRNYIIKSVKEMLNNERTQELLRLKEAVGFYGHKPRERAQKLFLGESEVINVNGRTVVVDNVPANRTVDISLDENTGIVTHTQEILDTPSGKIINALIEAGQGGWSWATGGRDTPSASYAKTFAGVDYVLQPNYLSLDHPTMMMESAKDRESAMFEAMAGIGINAEDTKKVLAMGESSAFLVEQCADLEQHNMYLESVAAEQEQNALAAQKKFTMLVESIENSLPVFLTSEQKAAMESLDSERDIEVVRSMFESIGRTNFESLPINNAKQHLKPSVKQHGVSNMIKFGTTKTFK